MASKTLPAWIVDRDTHVAACTAAVAAAATAKADAEAALATAQARRDDALAARDTAAGHAGTAAAAKLDAESARDTASAKASEAAADRLRAESAAALVAGAKALARAPLHFVEITKANSGSTGHGFEVPADARPSGDWELHLLVYPYGGTTWLHGLLGGAAVSGALDNWRIGTLDASGDDLSLVSHNDNGAIAAYFPLGTIRRAEWQWISIRRVGDSMVAALDGVDSGGLPDLHVAFNNLAVFTPTYLFAGYGGRYTWEGLCAAALLTQPLTSDERAALVSGVSPPPAKLLSRWAPETLAVRGGLRRWCDALNTRDLAQSLPHSGLTSYGQGAGGPAAARPYAITIPATAVPAASGGLPGEATAFIAAPSGARIADGDLVVVQLATGASLGSGITLDTASTYCAPAGLYLRLLNASTSPVTSTAAAAAALQLIV